MPPRPGRARIRALHRPTRSSALGAATAILLALCALLSGCSATRDASTPAGEAAILPEHYAHSIAALGWPGARRAFQIGPGSVAATGESALEWRLLSASRGVTNSPVHFERDAVPVAHWSMSDDRQRWEFEAAAVPRRALGDTSLLLSVRATAEWRGAAPGEAALEVRLRAVPDGPHCVPWDAPDDSVFAEWWQGREALRNGRIVAVVDRAATLPGDAPTPSRPATTTGYGAGALVARCAARLRPGERRHWDFLLPLYPVARGRAGALEGLAPAPPGALAGLAHERAVAESRRYWRHWLAQAAAFETPDTLVNLAWRAALVTLVACQERDQGHWVPIGNPFQYRDVWLRDGARVVRALAVAGLADLARDDARTLARFQLPTGALIS